MIELLVEIAALMNSNEITKYCMEKHNREIVKVSACASELRYVETQLKRDNLAKFLENNPHYRYPGLGLPNNVIGKLDECWGKTRTYGTITEC